jgi:hypothetical protein
MIPAPVSWFAVGAVFGAVLCGWPWHPRFSRYSRSSRYRAGEDSNGNCVPMPPGTPAPAMRREYIWNPVQMAECGGPCWRAQDPCFCDCGALWRDVPSKPVAFTDGFVQRGQGNGGLSTEKPPINPQLSGGQMVGPVLPVLPAPPRPRTARRQPWR